MILGNTVTNVHMLLTQTCGCDICWYSALSLHKIFVVEVGLQKLMCFLLHSLFPSLRK